MSEVFICQKIRCADYSTDDGDPAWCYWAGCPAVSATAKCPKVEGKEKQGAKDEQ